MAPTPIVTKVLTPTDKTCRLSCPTRLLPRLLGQHPNRNKVYFRVRDGDGQVWNFCCSTRQRGYFKPVVTGDWLRFVKSKALKAGDQVIFYEGSDPKAGFMVGVRRARTIRLFGHDIHGYTDEE